MKRYAILILLLIGLSAQQAIARQTNAVITLTVDRTDDTLTDGCDDATPNDCSLRGAIGRSNADAANQYVIQLPAGVYGLTGSADDNQNLSGDLDILNHTTIEGTGAATTIIDANGVDRVFDLPNQGFFLTLRDVTIANGRVDGNGAGIHNFGGGVTIENSIIRNNELLSATDNGIGGGIYSQLGAVNVTNSQIIDNRGLPNGAFYGRGIGFANLGGTFNVISSTIGNNVGGAYGGGVAVSIGNDATTLIEASTIRDNGAIVGDGGGIANLAVTDGESATLTIHNSTISDNDALRHGGGIYNEIEAAGTTASTISYSTITRNFAAFDDTTVGLGGGIAVMSGSVSLSQSILAGNIVGANGHGSECNGSIFSGDYLIIGDPATCSFGGSTFNSQFNTDPLLDDLAFNGGATATHALRAGSPAIDPIPTNICAETHDQRGTARPQNGACDIGAYELIPVNTPPQFTSTPITAANEDALYDYVITVDDDEIPTVTAPIRPGWLSFSQSDTGDNRSFLNGTPTNADVGSHPVKLVARDSAGQTVEQTFTIVVSNVNDAPTITAIADQTFQEDYVRGPLPFTLADADTPLANLRVTATSSNLTLLPVSAISLYGGGAGRNVALRPLANQSGTAIVTLTVSDGFATNATSFQINVLPANDAPTALTLSANTIAENQNPNTLIGLLSADDPDPDDTHTFTLIGGSGSQDNASFRITGDALVSAESFDFDTQPEHHIRVRATDAGGRSIEKSFVITVEDGNDAPVGSADFATTPRNTPTSIPILANDSDPDGDTVTIHNVGTPQHGAATVVGREIRYTPATSYVGQDTFTYTLRDGNGGTATANVTVLVLSDSSTSLDLVDDRVTDFEDTPLSIFPLANDPSGLTLAFVDTPNATLQENQLLFTPPLNFSGVFSFTYAAFDDAGNSGTATVFVTVLPLNDNPTARADSAETASDAPITIDLLANDSDPDGDTLHLVQVGEAAHGVVSINADDTVTYQPLSNAHVRDFFPYRVTDAQGGSAAGIVYINLAALPDAPHPQPDVIAVDEDTSKLLQVLANDGDDTLQIVGVSTPQHGTATIDHAHAIRYTPVHHYTGEDHFAYTVRDTHGLTATAHISLTVRPVVDTPVANPIFAASSNSRAPIGEIEVLDHAVNHDNEELHIVSFNQPEHGVVTLNPDDTFHFEPNDGFVGFVDFEYTLSSSRSHQGEGDQIGTVTLAVGVPLDTLDAPPETATTTERTPITINPLPNVQGDIGNIALIGMQRRAGMAQGNADGTITYTPPPNFTGTDVITYTVTDEQGNTVTGVITLTVDAANRAPLASADFTTTPEDTPITVDVLANDVDREGNGLTLVAALQPNVGTATLDAGKITYTPPPNFFGVATFGYIVRDGHDHTNVGVVRVIVTGVNDAPTARDDRAFTNEDTRTFIGVLANDNDVDHDWLTVTASDPPHGTVIVTPVGTLNYLPDEHFHGTDVISYTVRDPHGLETTAVVTVTVGQGNDAPTALDISRTILQGETLTITVDELAADLDEHVLHILRASSDAGSLTFDNATLTFTADPGRYAIPFTIADEQGSRADGVLTVIVTQTEFEIFLPLIFR